MSALATNRVPLPSSLSYKDYSSAGNQYRLLKGIEMKASTVRFVGSEKATALGAGLTFQKFEIVAPVTVQTSCSYVSGTYDTAMARYSLAVAPDKRDVARKEFMRQIKVYWKAKNAEELRHYKYMPSEKFLWMNADRYVLYLQPEGEWEGATYFLYTSGKVIRLTFMGFQSGGGWGGLSTFLGENLLFRFPDTQISAGSTPQMSPTQFWTRDGSGFFREAPVA